MQNHAVALKVTPFVRIDASSGSRMMDGMEAANNPPSLFSRVTLNTRSLKWKSRWGNM